jgi:hypothetical protein
MPAVNFWMEHLALVLVSMAVLFIAGHFAGHVGASYNATAWVSA